jgi:hypothetical protein
MPHKEEVMADVVGKKIDDNTMEFDKELTVKYSKVTFERGYLEKQRESIIKQRDEMIALKDSELAEVDGFLSAMDAAGIVAKSTLNSGDILNKDFSQG